MNIHTLLLMCHYRITDQRFYSRALKKNFDFRVIYIEIFTNYYRIIPRHNTI